ncbi:thiolase family protein [Virgibacillus byunsanensis]|uniref:acetyl-CoA C-acetyltransferase n=1 Tax=Virgibacillus byunsanensis TaxID=570945 RepID=A0ABW3LLZ3_9BACI
MVVIVNALRSPIGKLHGSLSEVSAEKLISNVIKNSFANLGLDKSHVEEVILGQTKQNSHAPNIARVASLLSGIPENVPAHTVHRQCGSGMQSVHEAFLLINSGLSEVVLSGGVESMSQAPYYSMGNRFLNHKAGNITFYDSNIESQPNSQPKEIYGEFNMGDTAEYLANKYSISREEQDEYALNSHLKALNAIKTNRFDDEIVPVEIDNRNGFSLITKDEHPRNTSIEKLSKLKPVFSKDGTVTAGNSSGRNDGAALLTVMSERKARELDLPILARIKGIASTGVHPKEMGLGPLPASQKALKMANLQLKDMDLIELNEAFAAQTLAVLKEWDINNTHVNVNGGSIALGHPLGCTGTRILVTLIHELRKRNLKYGLTTACIAGGQGTATVIENCQD